MSLGTTLYNLNYIRTTLGLPPQHITGGQSTVSLCIIAVAAGAIGLLGLTGCTKTIGKAFTDADVQKITIGHTEKSSVISALGKPYQKTVRADGTDMWTYLYRRDKANMALVKALPVAKLAEGIMPKSKVTQKTLELGFRNHIVSSCKLILFNGEGGGQSRQSPNSIVTMGRGNIRELDCGRS